MDSNMDNYCIYRYIKRQKGRPYRCRIKEKCTCFYFIFYILCLCLPRVTTDSDNKILDRHGQPKRCAYENVLSNHTFRRNKQAGVFTHLGHTTDIHQCELMCCKVSDCDVAFMPENHCYAVSCYSDQHCETTPAKSENFNVQMVKVRRVVIPNPDDMEPREEDIIRSSLPGVQKEEESEKDEGNYEVLQKI